MHTRIKLRCLVVTAIISILILCRGLIYDYTVWTGDSTVGQKDKVSQQQYDSNHLRHFIKQDGNISFSDYNKGLFKDSIKHDVNANTLHHGTFNKYKQYNAERNMFAETVTQNNNTSNVRSIDKQYKNTAFVKEKNHIDIGKQNKDFNIVKYIVNQNRNTSVVEQYSNSKIVNQNRNTGVGEQNSKNNIGNKNRNNGVGEQNSKSNIVNQNRNNGVGEQNSKSNIVNQNRNNGVGEQNSKSNIVNQNRNTGVGEQNSKSNIVNQNRNTGVGEQYSKSNIGNQNRNTGVGEQYSNSNIVNQNRNTGVGEQYSNNNIVNQNRNNGVGEQNSKSNIVNQNRNTGVGEQYIDRNIVKQSKNTSIGTKYSDTNNIKQNMTPGFSEQYRRMGIDQESKHGNVKQNDDRGIVKLNSNLGIPKSYRNSNVDKQYSNGLIEKPISFKLIEKIDKDYTIQKVRATSATKLFLKSGNEKDKGNRVIKKHGTQLAKEVNRACVLEKGITNEPILLHFIHDEKRLYCPVEKIGTTFWRRIIYTFSNKNPMYKFPFDVPEEFVHVEVKRDFSTKASSVLPNTTFSFLFVRNPFSRMLSAFIDKIVAPNPYYWREFGNTAIKRYRQRASGSYLDGHSITFSEFVKLVIDMESTNMYSDPHAKSIDSSCNPCLLNYSFIGRMETFKDDALYILKTLNAKQDIVKSIEKQWEELSIEAAIKFNIEYCFETKKEIMNYITWEKALQRLWLHLQMRGLISKNKILHHPVKHINTLTAREFVDLAVEANKASSKEETKLQKLAVQREAFASVDISILEKFVSVFRKDFQLFGYDPHPSIIFQRENLKITPKFFNYTHLN
ncbi:putative uncharacterized protein DDB_G0289263 [Ruditapes philippinarum]|uniref:putative uncharacterized protein DDB_G0289263 n=1 Tax=Ruditapes philippinarum TaxID=129788 RepID=UPI00295AE8C4|nr:putative uncharacterized protein DDB_G0289263 [Ruditapes philippinarum]